MPNRLSKETSPYLLQHAENPVDWYPWSEEAFDKARTENKPIFLSVGYSSCHWCHVMERESFEDEATAAILNEHFVSIKVDREERPDVDAIYMTAVQMLTGQGGWPMSVFMTPELKPFFGGTYFPPDSAHGRPGFKDVLKHLVGAYSQESSKVLAISEDLTERLSTASFEPSGDELPGREELDIAYRSLIQNFDSTFGGFGGAPKFPHSVDLSFLMRYWKRTGEKIALDMVLLSLGKMAEGGIYDQLGGGFHRYSVDRMWRVPHFEKMLYDNGLLARTYFEAFQLTGDAFFRRIGSEILDYVIREMTSPDGGFYSATDADSEGEEGVFFVWTPEEVETVLGKERAEAFCLYYDVTLGGNFENQTTILEVARPLEHLAESLKMPVDELDRLLAECRKELYDAREKREKPFRDEKVIASWNGLMLSAMARGYQVTGESRYREAAEKAAGFIQNTLIRDGVLHRIHTDGETKIPGYQDDYAYVTEAFIDLHEATFDPSYLETARALTDTLLDEFHDSAGKGFFYSAERHTNLIYRRKDYFDNATPSGNWVSALNFLRLAALTGESSYRVHAEDIYRGVAELIQKAPMGFAMALVGIDFMMDPPLEVVILGEPESARRALHSRFIPSKVVTGAAAKVDSEAAEKIPLLRDRDVVGEKTTVYLCENFSCTAPITDESALDGALDERVRCYESPGRN